MENKIKSAQELERTTTDMTLRQLGELATRDYRRHRETVSRVAKYETSLREDTNRVSGLELERDGLAQQLDTRGKRLLHPVQHAKLKKTEAKLGWSKEFQDKHKENLEYGKLHIDEQVSKSKEFFDEHASQLHDLAVNEAHMDGVEINVGQPHQETPREQ